MIIRSSYSNTPYGEIFTYMPYCREVEVLDEMAHNLWWVWNGKAKCF